MMKKRVNRDRLIEMGVNGASILERPDYDSAIFGVSLDGRVPYDFDLMVKHLMEEDGMSEEDAIDFIEFNTIRALPYIPNHPLVYIKYDE